MYIEAIAHEKTLAAIAELDAMKVPDAALDIIEEEIDFACSIGHFECVFNLNNEEFWEAIEPDPDKLRYTKQKWISKIVSTLEHQDTAEGVKGLGYAIELVPNSPYMKINWEA